MSVKTGDIKSVTLLPLNVTVKQSLDMVLFTITHYVLRNASYPGEGICMTIKMKRKIMSEMMTTYFPSLLLMMITFATTFFKPFFFEAALSVNLTTMLMMTNISIGKMQTLPTVAYIRMIDVWLVFCQLVPFVEVILLTAQDCYRVEEQEDLDVRSEKDKFGTALIQVAEGVKFSNLTSQ